MQSRPHDHKDLHRQGNISREQGEEQLRGQRQIYEQQQQQHQNTQQSASRSNLPHREPFFRFFSSPNVQQHTAPAEETQVRAKLEPLSTSTAHSTSPQVSAGHQGMASYSYSAMARLSINNEGKEVEAKDGRLPSIFANGEYGSRDDSRFGLPGRGNDRSPSGSGGSSPNLVSVREMQERERSEDGHARSRRRSGLYSPVQNGREDGMISLPPLRHGFAPSSPGGSSSNHNHSESNYHREEGGRVTGPQRTGRPHSQSVSSMITSPYSHSATPSTSSLLLPSPSGLSNLRPSFAYSPPRANKAPPAGPTSARGNEFPRLERHISSSSLPGESSGFLRPHHSFFPGGGLSMFTSRSGDSQQVAHEPSAGNVEHSPPLAAAPIPAAAKRGNIERLFRAATTRKKRSSSDASKTKGALAMTEIKDDVDEQLEGFAGEGKDGKDLDPSAVRRLAHLQCEQRRRESINGGFATLRSILPETTAADSKAAILQKAINYIQNLEQAVRMSGGRLDPGMTRSPSLAGQPRAPKRERRSTLSNSFSEAISPQHYAGDLAPGQGRRGGQTASSSTTDLVDVITDKDDDDTMRMDMDVHDDTAMAMSDDDEADDRRRSYGRLNGSSTTLLQHQQQQQQQQQHQQHHQQQQYHPNHHASHPHGAQPASNGSGHKKGGFSPLDLLVGVAEQARRVTGTGNHSKSHIDQAGHHVNNSNINGSQAGVEKTMKTGTRGSWAHIEVGDGR